MCTNKHLHGSRSSFGIQIKLCIQRIQNIIMYSLKKQPYKTLTFKINLKTTIGSDLDSDPDPCDCQGNSPASYLSQLCTMYGNNVVSTVYIY